VCFLLCTRELLDVGLGSGIVEVVVVESLLGSMASSECLVSAS
jgi:hypothetical protein